MIWIEKKDEPVMFAKSLVFWMNHIGQVCSRVFLIPENIFDMIVITIFPDNGRAQSDLTRQGPRLTLGQQVGWGTWLDLTCFGETIIIFVKEQY